MGLLKPRGEDVKMSWNNRIVVMLMLIAGTLTLTPQQANSQTTIEYYRIIVQDTERTERVERYKDFYHLLLREFNVDDLGYKNIGCKPTPVSGGFPAGTGCEVLDDPIQSQNVASLTFAMERKNAGRKLNVFMYSYHTIQLSAEEGDTFLMMIDGAVPASGACPYPSPDPDCGPRPICIQTSECDNPVGGKCQLCR